MPCLSDGSELGLSNSELVGNLLSSPQKTTNDINHSATSIGAQDLDGDEVDGLSNTGAVGAMGVTILINIILRDGGSPGGMTFKLDMIGGDTSTGYVQVDTLAMGREYPKRVKVPRPSLGDTRKTFIIDYATRAGFRCVPM